IITMLIFITTILFSFFFFFQAEDGIRDFHVTGVQTCALPILKMIEANNDKDLYIRHAGVLALSRLGFVKPIAELVENPSRSLRIAAVLVLRRLASDQVALFLKDQDEYIVTEAARAINDDWSIEPALPALAATLNDTRFTSEPLLRRAINACLRVGGEKELETLIAFVQREGVA